MASLIHDGDRKRIEFNGVNGGRIGIRLGKVLDREAIQFKSRIEYLTSVRIRGVSPDAETSKWLASLPGKIQKKLSRAGLIEAESAPTITRLLPFIDDYIAGRTDAKERTIINLKAARNCIGNHFHAETVLGNVTPGHADEFYRYLIRPKDQKGAGLSLNTARRICGRAKQFFAAAIRKRMLAENPFIDVKCRVQASSEEREYFVSREEAAKVIAACPDAEWRLIFALSRFGGLRCPSEHLALRLADIDLSKRLMIVRSPKTEHHEGKASRTVPIFPELYPYLAEVVKSAKRGQVHVITSYRTTNINLRKRLLATIKAAGLKPWPKIFHNLRASRQTELAAQFPLHVVCEWIGNSAAIAQKHYLQVIEKDFQKAIGINDANVTRNTSEYREISGNDDPATSQQEIDNLPDISTSSSVLSTIPENLGAQTSALVGVSSDEKGLVFQDFSKGADAKTTYPDLAEIIEAWPAMNEQSRGFVLATVRHALDTGKIERK